MNPNKALWEKGDFTRIAETMRESGRHRPGDSASHKGSNLGPRMRRWNNGIT